MKKILIILILLFFPIIVNAKVYWEEPYKNYQLIGTNLIINNVKIRYVEELENDTVCGIAMGGNGIAYLIQISLSNDCIDNIEEYFIHEFLHIYDYQNKVSHIAKNWDTINGYDYNSEKFAYWGSYYYTRPTWLVLNHPKMYKKLDNYFKRYKILYE